ncbi:MAG: efflux RND transporter periplasmic adaptor subunit [Planctomycetia bacterium]|nr:efflux RND transporter periplasmic adaptor subunit [Planctomycetia bacterium]
MRTSIWIFGALLLATSMTTGCKKAAPPAAATKAPEVLVERPIQKVVTEYEEFTGRAAAVQTVEIRARVSGFLEKVFFTDGKDVVAGAPLFQIDDRPYRAEVDRTAAAIEQAQAKLDRLKLQEDRAKKLVDSVAIPEETFEQIKFDRAEAAGALAAAQANNRLAALNLGFTQITSPISGRISRRMVDPGNLVRADETAMTTIVSVNPMYVYFDFDERTVLRLRRLITSGQLQSTQESQLPVEIALADEDKFSLSGKINFIDNQVDPNTGTLRVRAVVDNSSQMLSAGLFLRLRVPIGNPQPALLISEESLGTDQGERFVYVVNEKDEAVYRRVHVGWLTEGRRVVEDGLEPTDRVVVNGLQRIKAGAKVVPQFAKPAASTTAQTGAADNGAKLRVAVGKTNATPAGE